MRVYRISFRAMGGPAEVQVAARGERGARELASRAIGEVQRIEAKYSRYRADSWVGRLNAAAGHAAIDADEETRHLLAVADRLYRESEGRFDITSGVLRRAWDFRQPRLPDAARLEQLRRLIGWPRVVQEAGRVMLPEPGMEIDFGGFGKEYAVDRAADVLTRHGAAHALVNLAGDCRAVGAKPGGEPWVAGIVHPRQAGRLLAQVPLAGNALATSGDYERGFWLDNRRYGHVLDARTGWPVAHWSSVSVVAPSALEAGYLTTVAMLLESDGLAWLERSGRDFLAVDAVGRVHQSGPAGA